MSSNISGPSDRTSSSQIGSSEWASSQAASSAAAAAQVYGDTVDNGDTVMQQYFQIPNASQTNYLTDIGLPILPPPDPEGGTAPTPFEPSWQIAAKKDFKDRLREALIKQAKAEGSAADPLTIESRLEKIMKALTQTSQASLSDEDQSALKQAVAETQAAWSLPNSWLPTSVNPKDWTPVAVNVVPPVSIENERREVLAQNTQDLFVDMEAVAESMVAGLPPDDPKRVAVKALALILAQAISELKEMLQTMQLQDTKMTKRLSESKYELAEKRIQEFQDIQKEQEKAQKAQKKAHSKAKKTKIISLSVSVGIAVIAAIALPFTFGASTPLLIASATMLAGSTAYAVVDYKMNTTQQLMTSFNNWVENQNFIRPPEAMKGLILTIAVMVILLTAIYSGGASSSLVTSTAGKTVAEVSKQAVLQFGIMFVMTSNMAPELATNALIRSGAIDEEDEKAKMIAQIVVMIVVLVASMGVMAASYKTSVSGSTQGMGQDIEVAADTLKGAIKNFLTTYKSEIAQFLSYFQDALQLSALGVEAAAGISIGLIGLELVKILRDLGDAEKAEQITEQLIKVFEQLLANFQQGVSENVEWINDLNRTMDKAFTDESQGLTRATQQAMG